MFSHSLCRLTVLVLLDSVIHGVHAQEDVCHSSFERLGVAPLKVQPQVHLRSSLPDSHLDWMPDSLKGPSGPDFPAVFRYIGESGNVTTSGRALGELADAVLAKHGVIVIKGFGLSGAKDYSDLMHATQMNLIDYVGGVTSRGVVAPKITPASSEGSDVSMESHNDDPYWPTPPTRLALWAERPPTSGGQGFITDARATLRSLQATKPDLVQKLRTEQVRYEHFWPDERNFDGPITLSWQLAFKPHIDAACAAGTCNATQAISEFLHKEGYGFEWMADGGLKRWEVVEAIRKHPVTGEDTWFNQVTAMHCSSFDNHPAYPALHREPGESDELCDLRGAQPYHTKFGNGEQFPMEAIRAIRKAQWENSVAFDYGAGDIVLIDNYNAMHGRFSFEPPRSLMLAMVGPS